jgi:hypothetical protein
MRRGVYFLNLLMAAAFGLGLLVLVLYPEVVSAGLNRRVEQVVLNRALAGHPELRAFLDREETVIPLVRTLIEESKPAQRLRLRGRAVARYTEDRYANLVSELRRDLLIFCTTNLVLFILAAVAIRRQHAGRSALVLSTILMVSALAGTWCYYHQNWLETLLFSSYFGCGYVALVGVLPLTAVESCERASTPWRLSSRTRDPPPNIVSSLRRVAARPRTPSATLAASCS